MKKLLVFLSVAIIIFLSFSIENILFGLEDLKMESESHKKEQLEGKIDVQAEKIYLVKVIHNIQDGALNLKINNYSTAVKYIESDMIKREAGKDRLIDTYIAEAGKMKEYNILENILTDYGETGAEYSTYGREYQGEKENYVIDKIVFMTDKYERMQAEIEQKTGKILYYVGTSKYNLINGLSNEEMLRNYVRYLDLYIIDDWKYKDNILISEKAKLLCAIVYYEDLYTISIYSTTNEHIRERFKLIN